MPTRHDLIIAGSGLAGACAAFVLSRDREVLLLEAERPAAGASGAAAGLINPFMARRARPTWRLDEALEALRWIEEEAEAQDCFRWSGVLRPARNEKQAGFFQTTAEKHPQRTQWLSAETAAERFPAVAGPCGALWTEGAGAANLPALIDALLNAARARGAGVETGARVTGWGENDAGVAINVRRGSATERREATQLLLCVGQGFPAFSELQALGLQRVKGQTVRLKRPPALADADLPHCSGYGYLVTDGDTLIAGSTYEHDFTDLAPSREATRYILEKATKMVPALEGAEVTDTRAGARVMHEGSHLPAVGVLPGRERVWVFTALGSRGLLTAPLLARRLPDFLANPTRIPSSVQVPLGK